MLTFKNIKRLYSKGGIFYCALQEEVITLSKHTLLQHFAFSVL